MNNEHEWCPSGSQTHVSVNSMNVENVYSHAKLYVINFVAFKLSDFAHIFSQSLNDWMKLYMYE